MAWLIRMDGLRDLRRDDGLSDVSATVLGDGVSNENKFWSKAALSQSKWLQQMGSENELARSLIEKLGRELAEEKALADSLAEILKNCDVSTGYCCCGDHVDCHGMGSGHSPVDEGAYHSEKALEAYRKARGL